MGERELTQDQERILRELISLYRTADSPVEAGTIANSLDSDTETIRNQMQSLRAYQVVEGVGGPDGGFVPKKGARESLSGGTASARDTESNGSDTDVFDRESDESGTGTEVYAGRTVCPSCETDLSEHTGGSYCPNCGTEL